MSFFDDQSVVRRFSPGRLIGAGNRPGERMFSPFEYRVTLAAGEPLSLFLEQERDVK